MRVPAALALLCTAAQQQQVSDTTTGVEIKGRSAHAAETEAAVVVKIDGMGIRGREAARGDTNRNLIPGYFFNVQLQML